MIRIGIVIFLSVSLLVLGCRNMFLRVDVVGVLPEPVFQLERKLTISTIEVYKIVPSGERVDYWVVAAKGRDQEMYTNVIRYGDVPEGFDVYTAAKRLDYGYYIASINTSARTLADGGFIVVRNKEGELSVLSLNDPNKYKDTFFECIDNTLYFEDDLKARCFTSEYLN